MGATTTKSRKPVQKQQMVTPRTIPPETVVVISPEDVRYTLNELEFLDLRVQIVKARAKGWKAQWGDFEFEFDDRGHTDNWPKELFNQGYKLAMELAKSQPTIKSA